MCIKCVKSPSLTRDSFCADSGAHLANFSACSECGAASSALTAKERKTETVSETPTDDQEEDGLRAGQEVVTFNHVSCELPSGNSCTSTLRVPSIIRIREEYQELISCLNLGNVSHQSFEIMTNAFSF